MLSKEKMHLVCMGCQYRKLNKGKNKDMLCGLTNTPPQFTEECSNFVFYNEHSNEHRIIKAKISGLRRFIEYVGLA